MLPKKHTQLASQETHLISTSTARRGASTTPEAHTSDMPLVRKSLEGRRLLDSAANAGADTGIGTSSTVHIALDQHLHLQQKGTAFLSPQL